MKQKEQSMVLDEISAAIKHSVEEVGNLELVWINGRRIYTDGDLYQVLFDLSLSKKIQSIILNWEEYHTGYVMKIYLTDSSDGSTNITADVIQTIGKYLGQNTGRGFMGQGHEIQHELSLYKPYIRKKRRIAFVDVSNGRFDVVKTVKGHTEVKEWMKENGRYKEWHFGMVYGGGYGDLIDEHGISRKAKECVVIQMSKTRHQSDLVEDWRWECLFELRVESYPSVWVWDMVRSVEFDEDLGMP